MNLNLRQIERIQRYNLSRNRKRPEQKLLTVGVAWILAVTFVGLTVMLYILEPKDTLWATVQTKAARPSIEIIP